MMGERCYMMYTSNSVKKYALWCFSYEHMSYTLKHSNSFEGGC